MIQPGKKKKISFMQNAKGKVDELLTTLNRHAFYKGLKSHFKRHWIALAVILIASLVYFWPLIVHINSYNPGGDASFNAWTMGRNHYCMMRQGCPSYADGNIMYPHKNTMLYSEDQLSSALLTLPIFWFTHNPILPINFLTILSFALSGLFMYYLVRYMTKGKTVVLPILAGLVFEFAPLKIIATDHLQNQSIFYLPLAVLLTLKYFDTKKRTYLLGLFLALTLQFYASWDQMVFVLITFGVLLLGYFASKLIDFKKLATIAVVIVLASLTTLPLAVQYLHFSKTTQTNFDISDQLRYSASLSDYLIPNAGTLLGKVYYYVRPHSQVNSYNPDSYSYHGVTLYVIGLMVVIASLLWFKRRDGAREKDYKEVWVISVMILVGFFMSLGPLLKLKGNYLYHFKGLGTDITIPTPYILVDKFIPQLDFLRSIGRASILCLFGLCIFLGYFFLVMDSAKLKTRTKNIFLALLVALIFIDVLPAHRVHMSPDPTAYNQSIPAAYKYIKNNKAVDNYLVIATDDVRDYPVPFERALSSELLWAGYTNKDMVNGSSGYVPPDYYGNYYEFIKLDKSSVSLMHQLNIHFVLIDKSLCTNDPAIIERANALLGGKVYSDERYTLYKV